MVAPISLLSRARAITTSSKMLKRTGDKRHQVKRGAQLAPGPHTTAARQKTETITEIENETGTGGRESYSEELENCKPVGTPGSTTLTSNTTSITTKVRTGNHKADNLTQSHTSIMKCEQHGLKCLYTNANSLINKMDELRYRAEEMDIIAVTETWATAELKDG